MPVTARVILRPPRLVPGWAAHIPPHARRPVFLLGFQAMTNKITETLVYEKNTQRSTVYSAEIGRLFWGLQYLKTDELRAVFGGKVPLRLMVTVTADWTVT